MAPGRRRQRPTAAEGLAPRLPSGSWSGVTTSASVLIVAHGSPMLFYNPTPPGQYWPNWLRAWIGNVLWW